tara:strand:+ start:9916 stop:11169 length:1254 start_codon:yes stop_codon:yes gene_type:complete
MDTGKNIEIVHHEECRICGGKKLDKFLHLPNMPFTDDFITQNHFGQEFRADLEIFICCDCLTAQTLHDVDVTGYYEDYQYSVGESLIANRFMKLIAENLQQTYYPSEKSRKILEVGSGDGEQLLAFKEAGCQVLGYEPSSSLCKIARAKGIPTIQELFSSSSFSTLPKEFKEVDVVILSYTFDHLPNPRSFLADCKSVLNKENGLLVVEVHDLEKVVERKEYCLFEHEHSIYLTEHTAKELCKIEGFDIINFNLVDKKNRRANSLIFVATPVGSNLSSQSVASKTPLNFLKLDYYQQIGDGIRQGIANLEAFVDNLVESGKSLAGYGAGGRGVMTLAAMKNAYKFRYIVDRKPKGLNLMTPKSGVELVGIEALTREPVDEILVFSYGYMEEIHKELEPLGYDSTRLHSLLDILTGKF